MRRRMTPTPPLSSLRAMPGELGCWTNHRPWAVAVQLDAYERPDADPALRFFCRARSEEHAEPACGWGATLAEAYADCVSARRRLHLAALCDRVAVAS